MKNTAIQIKNNFAKISFYIIVLVSLASTILGFHFWSLALLWSGFLGSYAFHIHYVLNVEKGNHRSYYSDLNRFQILHQYIFNFGAAILGWFILWFLFICKHLSLDTLETPQTILFGLTIVSLSGYLPSIISKDNPLK
jgi:hypothetical protein